MFLLQWPVLHPETTHQESKVPVKEFSTTLNSVWMLEKEKLLLLFCKLLEVEKVEVPICTSVHLNIFVQFEFTGQFFSLFMSDQNFKVWYFFGCDKWFFQGNPNP
jgi:hypothetical protein